jgi:hypothetical protein
MIIAWFLREPMVPTDAATNAPDARELAICCMRARSRTPASQVNSEMP